MDRVKRVLLISTSILLIGSQPYLASSQASTSMESSILLGIFKFVFYLVLFIAVIFLTLYGTKYIAKTYNRLANSKYIDNIDAISLSNNTQVNLLKIDKYIYIVLIGDGKAILLDKILETDFDYQLIASQYDSSKLKMDQQLLESLKKILNKEDKDEKSN